MLPRPLYIPDYNGYSRRRSRSRRSSRRPKPEYDRNIVSAFFALASAVLLAIAEAEPKWLRIVGGRCSGQYIGLYKVIAYRSPEDLSKFQPLVSEFIRLRRCCVACCLYVSLKLQLTHCTILSTGFDLKCSKRFSTNCCYSWYLS